MTARRQFLAGCSAAIAAMSGGRVGNLVFADPRAASGDAPILVVVFLRGGCDGLSLVSPYDDPIYVAKRDTLAVRGALDIDPKNASFQSRVGLHPSAAPLKELYDQGALAAIHACGLDNDTRSHFDAMDYIERGTPGSKTSADGWLARHLRCLHPDGTVPSLAAGPDAPIALLGDHQALALPDLHTYGLSGSWFYTSNPDARYHDAILRTAANFYTGGSPLDSAARRTIETIRAIGSAPQYATSVAYPEGSFGDSLKTIAQTIKMDLGLRAATADLGGWDHHDAQGVNERGGPFNRLVDTLARGLHAFYSDLPQVQQRLTVVVMSEFGRRLGKNLSEGTDHGHGSAMLVLGGQVNGGQVYGRWPGLDDAHLNQREDLEITTDFRTVLGEIVLRQFGNAKLGVVFPGITPQVYGPESRLGLIKGLEIAPDYGGAL